jgi:ribosomal protein S18 acetylase RimI-like enzyme
MKIELLATEQDKLKNFVEIKKCDTIAHSPVYTFFLKTMAETIDNGFGIPVTSWSDLECEAIYAEMNNQILGLIVYSKLDRGTIFIKLGAVSKEFRGRGIYTILYKHLESVAISQGYDAISSLIHRNNTIIQETVKKENRWPEYCFYAKRL